MFFQIQNRIGNRILAQCAPLSPKIQNGNKNDYGEYNNWHVFFILQSAFTLALTGNAYEASSITLAHCTYMYNTFYKYIKKVPIFECFPDLCDKSISSSENQHSSIVVRRNKTYVLQALLLCLLYSLIADHRHFVSMSILCDWHLMSSSGSRS